MDNFGVVPTFLMVTEIFCPGFASNAVTSKRILSSAWIVTAFGGASGAREQPMMEERSAPQPSAIRKMADCVIFSWSDFRLADERSRPIPFLHRTQGMRLLKLLNLAYLFFSDARETRLDPHQDF